SRYVTQGAGQQAQLGGEAFDCVGLGAGLLVGRLDEEGPCLAVGLEVYPGGETVAEEEGVDVIAVNALFGGRVDFDPVAHSEQALGAGALPDQGIEGGEQRLALGAAGARGFRMEVSEVAPASDADRDQRPLLGKLHDARGGVGGGEAEIVAQVPGGGDSEGSGGVEEEAPLGILAGGCRQSEDFARKYAFGQIVDPLERGAAGKGGDLAAPEQPFQRLLGVAPLPPAAPPSAFEIRSRQWPFRGDAGEHRLRLLP